MNFQYSAITWEPTIQSSIVQQLQNESCIYHFNFSISYIKHVKRTGEMNVYSIIHITKYILNIIISTIIYLTIVRYFSFFILRFLNLVFILYLQHISIQTSHIISAQQVTQNQWLTYHKHRFRKKQNEKAGKHH